MKKTTSIRRLALSVAIVQAPGPRALVAFDLLRRRLLLLVAGRAFVPAGWQVVTGEFGVGLVL